MAWSVLTAKVPALKPSWPSQRVSATGMSAIPAQAIVSVHCATWSQ